MTDPLQLPLDVDALEGDELDAFFNRPMTEKERTVAPPDPTMYEGVGTIHKVGGMNGHHTKPKPKDRVVPYGTKRVKNASEGWTRDFFSRYGKITKFATYEYDRPDGSWGTASTNVDFGGGLWVKDEHGTHSQSVLVEVKAWSKGNSFSLARIPDRERTFLNDGQASGQLCIISMMLWPLTCRNYGLSGCDCVYLVTWQRWLEIEQALRERAKGNYKGRSLRRKDLDLLDGCKVERVSRRWTLEDGHWLTGMIE